MLDKILAYDLGTGGNKASLYDAEGRCLASVFAPYETEYPQTGWHEQRPAAWWDSVVQSTRQLLTTGMTDPRSIVCLAISGHSLGCVPLGADGRLLRQAVPIWSDKRPVAQAAAFFRRIDEARWYRLTGNGFPPPHYTVFKILWFRDHEPEMFRAIHKIVGTKDYINYRLTGRMATDYSYASGSGVYDLLAWDYCDELLAAAELPRSLLPEIVPSQQILGQLTPVAAGELGLPREVKVACGGVDNSCMALGARNVAEGRIYASLGSSSWIAVSSSQPLLDEMAKPYVFTHVVPGMFTSAVAIFSSGTSLKWVRNHLSNEMMVVGGGSRSKLWRQIFADVWEIDILKTNIGQEAGSLARRPWPRLRRDCGTISATSTGFKNFRTVPCPAQSICGSIVSSCPSSAKPPWINHGSPTYCPA